MAIIINEQRAVDGNIFQYEEKIKSPTSRMLDTTQTYTTYYHINMDETTTDTGFKDVASIIGFRSPIRFNKISNFPIYGLDQIVLQLQDSEQGLDTSYEGEAIILPNTIKPLQNDFFIIPVLKDSYIFRVTDISYDNIMPDNYYRINFQLEYIDDTKLIELEKQKEEDYVCQLENIGTENSCIINKKDFVDIEGIKSMYNTIIDFYKAMFYNERHNVFLCPTEDGHNLYDPMQNIFINKHGLFNDRNRLDTLILTDQYDDPKKDIHYAKSIYKFIEMRDLSLLNNFHYSLRPGVTVHGSSFFRWHENSVLILDHPFYIKDTTDKLFTDEFKTIIELNGECTSEHAELIKRYVRNEELKIKDISLKLSDELIYMNDSKEVFFFTPIIMYIIRDVIKNYLRIQKK